MAGNGDAERLAQVERAITRGMAGPMGQKLPPLPEATNSTNSTTVSTTDDVITWVATAAERCREAGRYAKDHGAYLDELSRAFAEKITADAAQYAANMLAAEERKMAELRRILGKMGGV